MSIYDVFAEIVRASMIVGLATSAWLAGDFREDQSVSFPRWLNGAIVIALMALMWALLSANHSKMTWVTPLLLGVAFNLGRWSVSRPGAASQEVARDLA